MNQANEHEGESTLFRPRQCSICQKPLKGKRWGAKTCGSKCRQQAHRDSKKVDKFLEGFYASNPNYPRHDAGESVTNQPEALTSGKPTRSTKAKGGRS